MNKSRLLYTLCAHALVFSFTESALAGELSVSVNDNLIQTLTGNTADSNASYQISTLAADSTFLRNGLDSASYSYVIKGQVSADDGTGNLPDTAQLAGSVNFGFNLPIALWNITAAVTFRGVQDSESFASASAGQLRLTSTGSASSLSNLTLGSGSQTTFDQNAFGSINNSTLSGVGSVSINLDMQASSDNVSVLTGGEAFAGIGQFSGLSSFSLDDALNTINPLLDDGAYLTLTFTPNLNLSGQILSGDLALESGEVLSGNGGVSGQVSGATGSTITSSGELTLGNSFSASGFDFSGTLNIENSTVILQDSNEANLGNSTTLAGGTLRASNGLSIDGSDTISGYGMIVGDVTGAVGSSITASSGGLTLGNSSSASGFDFSGTLNIENSTVILQDSNEANLGNSTTLAGGTLRASNGLSIDGSDTISGYGIIVGNVTGTNAENGIIATGTYTSTSSLNVGADNMDILSDSAANLGNSTTLAGGTLRASNGLSIDGSDTISGYGMIIGNVTGTNAENGLIATGTYTSTSPLNVGSDNITILSDSIIDLEDTRLSGGSLRGSNGLSISQNSTLSGYGTLVGDVTGQSQSVITAAGGELSLGNVASFNGFRTQGQIDVGSDVVTLNSRQFAQLGYQTNLSGGTLNAENGVFLGGANAIVGFGNVNAKIAAQTGSTISASGNLALGDANKFDGFYSQGNLETNENTVTINDRNEAVLGSLTTLGNTTGAGTLQSTNGMLLQQGNNLVGYGVVNGDFINQGYVAETSAPLADQIEFTGTVSGAGGYEGNILFSGTFTPGNSPALVSFENIAFVSGSTLTMEIGGLLAGSEYDVLEGIAGSTATLAGTLNVDLFDLGSGLFSPSLGDSFDILTAETLVGEFDLLTLAVLGGGRTWQLDYLFDEIGTTDIVRLSVVSSIPVPSAVWLFGSGLIGLAAVARRRRS